LLFISTVKEDGFVFVYFYVDMNLVKNKSIIFFFSSIVFDWSQIEVSQKVRDLFFNIFEVIENNLSPLITVRIAVSVWGLCCGLHLYKQIC